MSSSEYQRIIVLRNNTFRHNLIALGEKVHLADSFTALDEVSSRILVKYQNVELGSRLPMNCVIDRSI